MAKDSEKDEVLSDEENLEKQIEDLKDDVDIEQEKDTEKHDKAEVETYWE